MRLIAAVPEWHMHADFRRRRGRKSWMSSGRRTVGVLHFRDDYLLPPICDGVEGAILIVRLHARADSKWWKIGPGSW